MGCLVLRSDKLGDVGHLQLQASIDDGLSVQGPYSLVFRDLTFADLKQVQPPLQNMAKGSLGQLLEEFTADLGEKDGDLVFVVLLLKASIVKENELGSPRQRRQMAIEIAGLFPPSHALSWAFPAEHGSETEDGGLEWDAANGLADQRHIEPSNGLLQRQFVITFYSCHDLVHGLSLLGGGLDHILGQFLVWRSAAEMSILAMYDSIVVY